MGSLNPLIVTEAALRARAGAIAEGLAASVANFGGQLCTKPGIVLVPEGEAGEHFSESVTALLGERGPEVLLTGAIALCAECCGRLVFDGYPTGVAVAWAMQHGGPFPATTDARGTSVGMTATRRFMRPITFQNAPAAVLPPALQDGNPLGIWRRVDGELARA
jgi:NADP-dependent aldehyde dehydrogenase